MNVRRKGRRLRRAVLSGVLNAQRRHGLNTTGQQQAKRHGKQESARQQKTAERGSDSDGWRGQRAWRRRRTRRGRAGTAGRVRDAATLGDAVGAVAGRKGLTRGARGALVAASLALRQDDVAALDALLELLDACLQLVLGHLLPFRVAGLDSAMSCFRSRTVLRASKSGTRGHPTNSTPCFLRAWCAL